MRQLTHDGTPIAQFVSIAEADRQTGFGEAVTSEVAARREDVIRYLRESSGYYRQQVLDPVSALECTSDKMTPWVHPKQGKLALSQQLKHSIVNTMATSVKTDAFL